MTATHAIHHRIEIESTPKALFEALSTQSGLAAWWTPMTETTPTEGSTATFRFGDGSHRVDMQIDELRAERQVSWTCTDGPWQGMEFSFAIAPHERGAVLTFEHSGWPEVNDFYRHCNTKWGYFLASSLKPYLESGTGAPHPNDPSI